VVYHVYVIDDEGTVRDGIAMHLGGRYRVSAFADAESALKRLPAEPPDVVLLDVGLPGMNGIEALERIKECDPYIEVVMITAYEDVKTVVSAMKLGARDYVVKPLHMDSLENCLENTLEAVRLRGEVRSLQERFLKENLPLIVGESDAINDVMELIRTAARSPDTPILIVGPTGTGKELIASAIHYRSPNFKGPMVTVNCAAIPDELIESELFGYEKGAFSGARASGKRGLVEESRGGTLFLDEVGDLSPDAQSKLLRFLEEGEFYRVGGTATIGVQTRVLSATNKDLGRMIADKRFREDLYFRLGVVKIEVPSLNERRADIIPLAEHFLANHREKFNKPVRGLSDDARDTLLDHHWTGNVRELKNCIERGVLFCRGDTLSAGDLGLERAAAAPPVSPTEFPPLTADGIDYTEVRKRFERYYLERALELAQGNESGAARLLGINHHTFRYHRKKLDE
jgi:DNA-binding NtrC family response regulator